MAWGFSSLLPWASGRTAAGPSGQVYETSTMEAALVGSTDP